MRALLFIGLLIAVAVASAGTESGLPMWWHLRGELEASQVRLDELQAQNAALVSKIEALKSDPFALERAIREDLELARSGETIVRFGPEDGSNVRFR